MAKAKAMVSKRTAAKRVRRRPNEYDHQYGLRVEAPTRPARAVKAKPPEKKQ